ISRGKTVTALRGQTLRIPNLYSLFGSWPKTKPHLNGLYKRLQPTVNGCIKHLAEGHPPAANLKTEDLGRLVCLWYPKALLQQLKNLVIYTTWHVTWSDAVDSNAGHLSGDSEQARQLRRQTLRMTKDALALAETRAGDKDSVSGVFRYLGKRLLKATVKDQRRRLYSEIQLFINSCEAEQTYRSAGRFPDFESYMKMRIGTSGGRILCCFLPYVMRESFPALVSSAPEIEQMSTQVSILMGIMNDVLSLKKELLVECPINAITVAMEHGLTLDAAVDDLEERMQQAVKEFDEAGNRLSERTRFDRETQSFVFRYIQGCRSIVTGTLDFTLSSPRYGISELIQEDGSLRIPL
ncbi:hypothetical protein F66182_11193, partial [Fusarium sp. NRRL 66182]